MDKMKKLFSAAVLFLLCACGEEYTGLGSVDLHVTSITFSDSDPATITGILPLGKPAEFLQAVDAPQVREISVRCSSSADTSGFAEANKRVSFLLFVDPEEIQNLDGIAEFKILHAGLSWFPSYSIRADRGSRRIYATAQLKNATTQTWQTDTVRLTNRENNLVTTAAGRITIRPGTSPVPWWDAAAGAPLAVIMYGWPVQGRWNPMVGLRCPSAGKVENWGNDIYQKNDTLWFPADSLLELDLAWQQMPTSYRCSMRAISLTDQGMEWNIRWPKKLPRGADIEPGIERFELSAGESVTIQYREIY